MQRELVKIQKKVLGADTCIKEINDSSTNHPAHTVVHEVLHGENNWFTSTRIPERFSDTVDKLSIYAKESAQSGKTKETLTELRAEEVINGSISKDRSLLLEYLK